MKKSFLLGLASALRMAGCSLSEIINGDITLHLNGKMQSRVISIIKEVKAFHKDYIDGDKYYKTPTPTITSCAHTHNTASS